MALLVGLKETQKFLLLFTDPKLERRRMKILRGLALKLSGSLKLESGKEFEMILKRTLQSICILTINPNTTTSIIIQVVHDGGALLPSAINSACPALVDAGIPMKHLAESGYVILDPTKLEEQKMKAFTYLVFPNSILSVFPEVSSLVHGEPMEHGIITSVTHGAMSVDDYFHCLAKLSDFLRRSLQSKLPGAHPKQGDFEV